MSQKRFSELDKQTSTILKLGQNFNAKGRVMFPFAMLMGIGISNFKQLKQHYKEVKAKTSNLSSSQRRSVLGAYALCTSKKVNKPA